MLYRYISIYGYLYPSRICYFSVHHANDNANSSYLFHNVSFLPGNKLRGATASNVVAKFIYLDLAGVLAKGGCSEGHQAEKCLMKWTLMVRFLYTVFIKFEKKTKDLKTEQKVTRDDLKNEFVELIMILIL